MSTFATYFAIFATLNGIILLGSVSPASAYRSFSFKGDIADNRNPVLSESGFQNTTLFYGDCSRPYTDVVKQEECILHRVQADFSGDSPKDDECKITLQSESGGNIYMNDIDIYALDKDRAIMRWFEDAQALYGLHFRFSIVDFSNCKVTTTKIMWRIDVTLLTDFPSKSPGGFFNDFLNKPRYLKEDDNFQVLSFIDKKVVNRSSINTEGVISDSETWLTYPAYFGHPTVIFPLSKDNGYLLIETSINKPSMTVAHIQPNGQRKNLTYVEDVHQPMISLANGLIGICFVEKKTTMICTQFKLGDKEINWFSASNAVKELGFERAIYNLPRGEGFLTHVSENTGEIFSRYLVKIGLDGKVEQLVDTDLKCLFEHQDPAFYKIFEDDQGNYCVSAACMRYYRKIVPFPFVEGKHVKFQSKCFEPEDFQNISKHEIKA